MLRVWIGDYDRRDGLEKPDWWFNKYFDAKYTMTEFSRRLIKDCSDGSEVLAEGVFKHPTRGFYSLDKLPTGVKTALVAVYRNDRIPNLLYCGNNCIPYILEVAENQDVTVSIHHRTIPFFIKEFGLVPKNGILILNNNKVIHSYEEWLDSYQMYKNSIIV